MSLNIGTLIEAALALCEPPDLSDVDLADLDDSEAMERLEAVHEERERERLEAFLAGRSDKLMALRYVRAAQVKRHELLAAEIVRLQKILARTGRATSRVEEMARLLLKAEREARGDPEQSYAAKLPDGSSLVLRVARTKSVHVEPTAIERLPDELVKVERNPKKIEIRKLLDAGKDVPGCSIVERVSERVEGWSR